MRLGAEIAVADIDDGGVESGAPLIAPNSSGFTAYININDTLRAVPVRNDGSTDLAGSIDVGASAQVAISQTGTLFFGTENGSVFTKPGPDMPQTIIIPNATLQRAACDGSGCAVTFFPAGSARPSIVVTDAEGQPITNATPLPDFPA